MIRSLLLFFFISFIVAEPREGIDYVLIPEGLVKENGVTEVFWYGCPGCFAYEEVLDEIRERRPDVKINLIPLWDEPTAKTYYTIKFLGLEEEAHRKVFEDWQLQRKTFNNEKDIRSFAKRHGYDEESFAKTFNSFGVQVKARNAISTPRKFVDSGVNFSGTPTTIVNKIYLVNRQRDRTKEIETILFLLDK